MRLVVSSLFFTGALFAFPSSFANAKAPGDPSPEWLQCQYDCSLEFNMAWMACTEDGASSMQVEFCRMIVRDDLTHCMYRCDQNYPGN